MAWRATASLHPEKRFFLIARLYVGAHRVKARNRSAVPVHLRGTLGCGTVPACEEMRGVELLIVNDPECIELREEFIAAKPELWNEDIGR